MYESNLPIYYDIFFQIPPLRDHMTMNLLEAGNGKEKNGSARPRRRHGIPAKPTLPVKE